MNIAELQKAIGTAPDGVMGIASYTALFRKCGAQVECAQELAVCANRWFSEYELLVGSLRLPHFMAQICHESGSFRYMEEIASGQAYEGRGDLGNTQPGDGKRYKGRGPLQLTGRANYRAFGRRIGIDIERHPDIAAYPSIGLLLALQFWKQNSLNTLADRDDLRGITRRINGGLNGLDDRMAHLTRIKSWMP